MKRSLPRLFRALLVFSALSVPPSTVLAQVAVFANPTPALDDRFGSAVAAVGTDSVLIGAWSDDAGATNSGAAYLFSTNGTLLTTFINPTPAFRDYFGRSVAAVGTDRVLIGAHRDSTDATDAGTAYLFSTNGAWLATFAKPTPESGDYFGWSVAAVGSDRVLIGALCDNTGALRAGAAYLFNTDGTLVATFPNPTPGQSDEFGCSVVAVGSDRVLIGARRDDTSKTDAGAAYLFGTNGVLLTTFTNPAPAAFDYFGSSVAAIGIDRVLIAADYANTGASDTGAAYLFNTNGALLATFTNPTPGVSDYFGCSIAAVGTDRVVIGARFDSTGAGAAGAAYLFTTNGAFLTALLNPTPAYDEYFGCAVAAVGRDRVLIGADFDDASGPHCGAAYLLALEPSYPGVPTLSITLNPQLPTFTLSWPVSANAWVLEQTSALNTRWWEPFLLPCETNAGTVFVTLGPHQVERFFRLRLQ